MNKEHEDNMEEALEAFNNAFREKYRKGQAEHGGQIWEKPGLIDMAMEEVLDQWCYLYNLKLQLLGVATVDESLDERVSS